MLENLSYTIPAVGRISIGEKQERASDGKMLPKRLSHFNITAQHKRDGKWVAHPAQKAVALKMDCAEDEITEIPVKLMFNSPDLNMRERRESYDNGRMMCASCGSGKARRVSAKGYETVDCPGAEQMCAFAQSTSHGCELMGRLNVQIDVETTGVREDVFSSFILRTRGYNSVRTLRSKLNGMAALFKNRLLGIPLVLKLRKKSSQLSRNTPFYYVDLVLACAPAEAAKLSVAHENALLEAGLDQQAYEQAVLAGLANGPFEDTIEESVDLDEFLNVGNSSETVAPEVPLVPMTAPAEPSSLPAFGLDMLRSVIESGARTSSEVTA